MKFHYLSKEEREVLRKVKTTPEQAEQIKRRNQPMLDLVRAWLEYNRANTDEQPATRHLGNIGCPHCINVNAECNRCAWKQATHKEPVWPEYCCFISFSGISYTQCLVKYGIYFERIECLDERSITDLRKAEKFLAGHVEWANWVLTGYEDAQDD